MLSSPLEDHRPGTVLGPFGDLPVGMLGLGVVENAANSCLHCLHVFNANVVCLINLVTCQVSDVDPQKFRLLHQLKDVPPVQLEVQSHSL